MWLQYCQDDKLLAGLNSEPECDLFIFHREDQSFLSILAKSHGIRPYSDLTDYGFNPARSVHNNKQILRLPEVDDSRRVNRPYFLL